jgi:hypothetical protein
MTLSLRNPLIPFCAAAVAAAGLASVATAAPPPGSRWSDHAGFRSTSSGPSIPSAGPSTRYGVPTTTPVFGTTVSPAAAPGSVVRGPVVSYPGTTIVRYPAVVPSGTITILPSTVTYPAAPVVTSPVVTSPSAAPVVTSPSTLPVYRYPFLPTTTSQPVIFPGR